MTADRPDSDIWEHTRRSQPLHQLWHAQATLDATVFTRRSSTETDTHYASVGEDGANTICTGIMRRLGEG